MIRILSCTYHISNSIHIIISLSLYIYIRTIVECNHHHHSFPSSIPRWSLATPLGLSDGRFSSYPVTGSFSRSVRENPGISPGEVGHGCRLNRKQGTGFLAWDFGGSNLGSFMKYSFKQPLILKKRIQATNNSIFFVSHTDLVHVNLLSHGKLSRVRQKQCWH